MSSFTIYCKKIEEIPQNQFVHYVQDICGPVRNSYLVKTKSTNEELIFIEFFEKESVNNATQAFQGTSLQVFIYDEPCPLEKYLEENFNILSTQWKGSVPILPSPSFINDDNVVIDADTDSYNEEDEDELNEIRASFVNDLLESEYVNDQEIKEEFMSTISNRGQSTDSKRSLESQTLRHFSNRLLESIDISKYNTVSENRSRKIQRDIVFKPRKYTQIKNSSKEKVSIKSEEKEEVQVSNANEETSPRRKRGHVRQKASVDIKNNEEIENKIQQKHSVVKESASQSSTSLLYSQKLDTSDSNINFLHWSMVKRNVNNWLDWIIDDMDRNTTWGLFFVEKITNKFSKDLDEEMLGKLRRMLLHYDQIFENTYSSMDLPDNINGHYLAWSIFDILYNRMLKTLTKSKKTDILAKLSVILNLVHLNCGYRQLIIELKKASAQLNCSPIELDISVDEETARVKLEEMLLEKFFNRPPPKSLNEFNVQEQLLRQLISYNLQAHQLKLRFQVDKKLNGFECLVKFDLARQNLEQIDQDIQKSINKENLIVFWNDLENTFPNNEFLFECNEFLELQGVKYSLDELVDNAIDVDYGIELIYDPIINNKEFVNAILNSLKTSISNMNYQNLFDITFFVYLLTRSKLNSDIINKEGLTFQLIQLAVELIKNSETLNEQDFIILLNIYKTLDNLDIELSDKPEYKSIFTRSIKFMGSIVFTKYAFKVSIAILDFISNAIQSMTSINVDILINIIERLSNFLGWPQENLPEVWKLDDDQYKFDLQMKILDILSICFTDESILRTWSIIGGFQKITDFIFWTTVTFPYQNINSILISQGQVHSIQDLRSKSESKLSSWNIINRNLKHLFDSLFTMCLQPINNSNQLIMSIITLVMDLFNDSKCYSNENSRARKYIKGIPELQLNSLSILTHFVNMFSSINDDQSMPIWKILEKEEYFFSLCEGESVRKELKTDFDLASYYLISMLEILSFQFLTITTMSKNDYGQIEFIIQTMRSSCNTNKLKILYNCSQCLLYSITHNEQLFKSYSTNYIMNNMIIIMNQISQSDDSENKWKTQFESDIFHIILNCAEISIVKDGAKEIVEDYGLIKKLFSMVTKYSHDQIGSYIFPIIVQIMLKFGTILTKKHYRFFKLFSKLISKTSDNTELQKLILDNITETLTIQNLDIIHKNLSFESHKILKIRQKAYLKSKIMSRISSLLNNLNLNSEKTYGILLASLKCLTSLIKNSKKSKKIFKEEFGYHQITNLLLQANVSYDKIRKQLIVMLFDMCLDANYRIELSGNSDALSLNIKTVSNKEIDNPAIANSEVISMFFKIIGLFDNVEKNLIFKTIYNLISVSDINKRKCANENIFELCLEYVRNLKDMDKTEYIFEIMYKLGSYNMNVIQLKKLLQLVDPFTCDIRPIYTCAIVELFEKLFNENKNDRLSYIIFDGINSGLNIPKLNQWPTDLKGNSICANIRIEQFNNPITNEPSPQILLSLVDKNGIGYQLYFEKPYLYFEAYYGADIGYINKHFDIEFEENKWYFITISFGIENGILGKLTKLNLFVVNEEMEFKSSRIIINTCLLFQNISNCVLGNFSVKNSLYREETLNMKPFYGMVYDFLIIEDYIFKDKFMDLFMYNSSKKETYSKLLINTSQDKLILYYNCLAMDEKETNKCYDQSIHKNHAILNHETYVVHRITPLQSLSCIQGGIYTLYPLLLLVDMYESQEQKELFNNAINADLETSTRILNDIYIVQNNNIEKIEKRSFILFEKISQLILQLIVETKFQENQYYINDRVPLFSYLLLKLSPQNISKKFLFSLLDLIDSDKTSYGLKECIFDNLILDFHLWSYTDFEIQIQLFNVVIPRLLNLYPQFSKFITVKRLIEGIQTFYWTVASHDSMGSNNILHPVLKHVVSQRPTKNELLHIRSQIYSIIYDLISCNITLEDSKAVINIIVNCNDPILIGEYYSFVINMLEKENIGKIFTNHIISIGYEILTYPLNSKINSIREQTIYFLCNLQNHLIGYSLPTQLIYDNLRTKLNDNRIYRTLLNAAVGSSYNKQPSVLHSHKETLIIKYTDFILIALQLCRNDKAEYVHEFLNELLHLMCSNESNIQSLISVPYWEFYLISYLNKETKDPNLKMSIKLAVTNIFISYILFKIKDGKMSISFMLDLLCWCNISLGEDNSTHNSFFQDILQGVLDPIILDLKKMADNENDQLAVLSNIKDKEDPVIVNIIQLIIFIADYCIHSIKLSDVYILPQTVRDSGLLQQLNEIIFLMNGKFNVNINTSSTISFKKGVFKLSNDIPLLFKLSFMQIYSLIDLNIIQLSIDQMWSYITQRDNIKKDEAFYIAYHTLNAITLRVAFRNQFSTSNEENESILKLLSLLLQFVGNIFKRFYSYFAGLKKLGDKLKTYMENIIEAPAQKFLSHPNQLESLLHILKNNLVSEKVSTYISSYINKNIKSYKNMFEQQQSKDSEMILKFTEELEDKKEQLNNRTISKQRLKIHYSYISNKWNKIERILKNEGGVWGYDTVKEHWKLSRRENHLRMRICLKENTNFIDHSYAAKGSTKIPKNELKKLTPSLSSSDLLSKGRPDLSINNEDIETSNSFYMTPESYMCELIQPLMVTPGIFKISEDYIYFIETELNKSSKKKQIYKKIPTNQIKHIYTRRYKLQLTAIEIFLTKNKSYFFNFNENPKKIYDKIKSLNLPNREKEITKEELLKKWLKGSISNFEYLMHLNTLAGRTYNDISQYPIFPWVLVDFQSETIDLSDPKIYRDLSKPIGALNEKLLELYQKKAEELPQNERYLYSIYYSNPSIVLYYLIRLEPFTTLSVTLHDNRFDCPDRMFYSFHRALCNSFESLGDIKELVPEFFYLPECLENTNKFSFGSRQDGKVIDDVELPPWAKTSEEFIRIHRQALESDYVSSNLHNWIDLIFGYKQKDEHALEAHNTFHPYLYAENINFDDPETKRLALSMNRECGQVPIQLFNYKHPNKKIQLKHSPTIPLQAKNLAISKHIIIWISISMKKDNIIAINSLGDLIISKPELFDLVESKKNITKYYDQYRSFSTSYDGLNLFSINPYCGINNIALETDDIIQNIHISNRYANTLKISEKGNYLIVGYKDSSIIVWQVEQKNSLNYIDKPISYLCGHLHPVRLIDANERLGLCLSLSDSNTCLLHWLNKSIPIRTIRHEYSVIDQIFLSLQGFIVFFSKPSTFYLYTVNGKLLNTFKTEDIPNTITMSYNGEYIITGGQNVIIVRKVFNFEVFKMIKIDGTVTAISSNKKYIIVGLKEGQYNLFNFTVD